MIGPVPTVKVASVLVALFIGFVNTARYRFEFNPAFAITVSGVEVAPAMFVNVVPAFMLTCHCTVGVGVPLAAELKVAVAPVATVTLAGFAVTTVEPFAEEPQPATNKTAINAQTTTISRERTAINPSSFARLIKFWLTGSILK